MKRIKLISICVLFIFPTVIFSQTNEGSNISGSLETNSIYYLNDSAINALAPNDNIGSNSYFKFDYRKGNFTAGIQYEAYLPPLVGYSPLTEGAKLVHRFASYRNDFLTFTAGNFYEQFGSGLVLRTYEERSLGINNSIDGISLNIKPADYLEIKTLWGKQRNFLEVGNGTVRGVDIGFQLSQLINPESSLVLILGGSWVQKHQVYTGPIPNFPSTANAYAGRVQLDYLNYGFYGEYVLKERDPSFVNLYSNAKGNALLIQQTIAIAGFGANITARRLENIDYRSDRDEMANNQTINYLPALTRQHKYQLAGLHPYSTRAKGEIGGQIEIFNNFSKGSIIGGSNGLKMALNLSGYYTLDRNSISETKLIGVGDTMLFMDYNIEIEKKISSKLKSSISYIGQSYNKGAIIGGGYGTIVTQTAVVELLYKLTDKTYIKAEISELWGLKGEDDWSLILTELSIAPKWTFFVSDMIQHVGNKVHYLSGGTSYTRSSTKVTMSFGRSREGLQCVGGMCKFVPAYTGFNLSLTSTF